MALRSCILTLLVVYPVMEAAGVAWFMRMVRKHPHKDPAGNRRVTVLRFLLYVVLLPLGVTIAMAILGWLDPLFFMIRAWRR
jgi:hypothetical protein